MNRERLVWTILLVLGGAFFLYRAISFGAGSVYVEETNGEALLATGWEGMAGAANFSLSRTIGVWVAAILTLCILSFVYRDNPFYKVAESLVVGVSAAYWMVVAFWEVIIPNLVGKMAPELVKPWAMPDVSPVREDGWYLYILVLVLGVMLLMRLSPKGAWISRWPLAFIIGTTAGLRLPAFLHGDFISQISNSVKPMAEVTDGSFDVYATLSNITLIIGILACLVYFFFSVEHKGTVGRVAQLGIWFLMVTFGAAFGYTVMGRIALLAMRLEFLFDDWLWIIDPKNLRPPDWSGWF